MPTVGQILTDEDKDNIKMFALRLTFKLTREFHDKFRWAFADKIRMKSLYVLHRRMAILSGIIPQLYDCCPASCCAYTGELAEVLECPHCSAPRFSPEGKTLASFEYLPMIPRLQALYENQSTIDLLTYRTAREQDQNRIADVYDGIHYKTLLGRQIVINGVEYNHTFFSDRRDIALGLMGDGFQLFKRSRRGHSSAWPFILINYSLSPEIRTHIENVIPLFIIPGPTTPKNFNSFLFPFTQESQQLAIGITTLDVQEQVLFPLRAYPIINSGDMVAIRYTQCMKGPNAFAPCRVCRIQGCRDVEGQGKHYYVPLVPPKGTPESSQGSEWDPYDLPLRTNAEIVEQLTVIRAQPTKKAREWKAMLYGINGDSILFTIPSMSRTMSFPYEAMHLLFENHVPNMVKFWKGTYAPNLDEGTEEYVILPHVWETIGKETAAAVSTIPSAFVSAIPDIYLNSHLYTAEMWCFWIIYIAPHVLKNRFQRPKYYTHMLKLVDIIKTALQFSITRADLAVLRIKIIEYVQTYER